jgi:acetylglutamate synthase
MIKQWLLSRKWLWKKVIFDNGVAGKNYYRYDHRIFNYCQGMGNNGELGDVNTAIEITLEYLNHTSNCFEKRKKLKTVSNDVSELIDYAKNTTSANVSHKMPAILNRLNDIDKNLKGILFDDHDDRTEEEKRIQQIISNG